MVDGAQSGPLRERKKEKLRRNLMETSKRLFCEHGYDETTLERICEEHDVHVRTLLRYFGNKEELAISPARDGLDRFKAMLEALPPGGDPIECWRDYVRRFWVDLDPDRDMAFRYLRLLQEITPLRAMVYDLDREFEDALGRAISRQAGTHDADDVYAQMLATNIVFGGRNVASHTPAEAGLPAVVDRVIAVSETIEKCFPTRGVFEACWVPPVTGAPAPRR